jgi:hypothetical protein
VGRIGTDYAVEWTGMVSVRLSPRGEVLAVNQVDSADARLVGKILDHSIPAMALHLAGGLSFHASAVVRGHRAIAFLGASGRGKSTLASALCLRASGRLLADDITTCVEALGTWVARGVERQSWLDPSARRALLGEVAEGSSLGKEPVPLPNEAEAPLAALVLLEEAPTIDLVRLTGLRAAEVLLTQLIRLELEDPAVQVRDLERIELLLRAVPVFVLHRPLSFDALPQVIAAVESMVGQA